MSSPKGGVVQRNLFVSRGWRICLWSCPTMRLEEWLYSPIIAVYWYKILKSLNRRTQMLVFLLTVSSTLDNWKKQLVCLLLSTEVIARTATAVIARTTVCHLHVSEFRKKLAEPHLHLFKGREYHSSVEQILGYISQWKILCWLK